VPRNGARLVFDRRDAERISNEITDASNSEDAFAEMAGNDRSCRTFARRAAMSLAIVAGKVLSQSGTN
jgi:hypothetical protein